MLFKMDVLQRNRRVFLTLVVIFCTVCCIHSQTTDEEERDPRDTSPPAITEHPSPSRGQEMYIMDKRVALELKCQATAVPPPTYKWLKFPLEPEGAAGVELDADSDPRITITDGDLTIGSEETQSDRGDTAGHEVVTSADEGIYQCIAENTYGSALSKKVEARLAFLGAFDSEAYPPINAQVGEKLVLECNPPSGVPPSEKSIYWTYGDPGQPVINPVMKDDRVLQDANGNLVFANLQESDTYDYICNVPNQYIGEVKTSPVMPLKVFNTSPAPNRQPSWVYKPDATNQVLRTKTLSLKCVAEGNPTPSISWSWEDSIDIDAGRIRKGPEGAELEVQDITFDDAGDYTCTASNGVKAPITYTTAINVRSAPYWDPNPPKDETIAPKESVTITCQAGGSPAATVSWLINGQPVDEVEPNPRREITSGQGSGQVIVNNAEASDSAVFQCIAKNVHGEEITSVFLNVLAIPAEIRKRPNAQYEVEEGSSVEMKCKPFGKPNPTVTWTFNGAQIAPGDRHSIESGGTNEGMLTISEIALDDAGIYNCNVTNDFGSEDASPRLIVRKKTKVTKGPGDVEVTKGANAVLKCEIDSDDELDTVVTWSHNGEELDTDVDNGRYRQSGDESLTIITVVKEDGGEYTCRAVTPFSQEDSTSEDSATGTLTVLSVPDPPFNTEVVDPNELEATVRWTPGFDGNSPVTQFIIEYAVEFEEFGWQEMGTVTGATTEDTVEMKPYNTYEFRVKAVNAVGESSPSETSNSHTTPKRKPSENPENVRGEGPQPGLMIVKWEKVHPVDYAGPDFKYIVRYRPEGETEWLERPVGPESREYEVTSDIKFQEYRVQVISENSEGRSTTPPVTTIGYSGESEPTAAPSDVSIEVLDAETVQVTWTPVAADSINGQILGYNLYFTIVVAANSETSKECKESPCNVDGLEPFSDYTLEVAVFNGAGEGPRSEALSFSTPQGAPSKVLNLIVTPSSDRILVEWDKPEKHNGILQGYDLEHSIMLGNTIVNTTKVPIDDADQTRHVISEVQPARKYTISVVARTVGGASDKQFAETNTREKGVPIKLDEPIFDEIGPKSVNVSYKLPADGPGADHIAVKYHKKDEDVKQAQTTEFVDIFDQKVIHIPGLESNTQYVFQLVAKNSQGKVEGEWAEAKTSGTAEAGAGGFRVEGWFVALIVIIIILLLILLIICVLKSQKGGKYNVSDKEQQLKGDIESTPLKDEGGFEEFQPRDGNMDEGAPLTSGSHPSLNESDPGSSETDSLKEYADGDTGKFNEEGSFIGQYGDRKTRPPDDNQEGGAAYSTFV